MIDYSTTYSGRKFIVLCCTENIHPQLNMFNIQRFSFPAIDERKNTQRLPGWVHRLIYRTRCAFDQICRHFSSVLAKLAEKIRRESFNYNYLIVVSRNLFRIPISMKEYFLSAAYFQLNLQKNSSRSTINIYNISLEFSER